MCGCASFIFVGNKHVSSKIGAAVAVTVAAANAAIDAAGLVV